MLRTRHREQILLRACLEARQPFVIDNTNLTREARRDYIQQAHAAGFRVIGYYFQTTLQTAIERNNQRTGKAMIPVKGILAAHKKLEIPSFAEGFDELHYVELTAENGFVVREWRDEI